MENHFTQQHSTLKWSSVGSLWFYIVEAIPCTCAVWVCLYVSWRAWIYMSNQCPCSSALRGPKDPCKNSPNSASPDCSTCCDTVPVEETPFQHGAARMVAECGLGSLYKLHGAQIPILHSGRSLSPKPALQPVAETLQLNNWHPQVRSLWSGILTSSVCTPDCSLVRQGNKCETLSWDENVFSTREPLSNSAESRVVSKWAYIIYRLHIMASLGVYIVY